MVAETVTDVSKLLWAVVVMDADVWVEFGEALVLGVDFEALGSHVETPGVDTLIVAGLTVAAVTFLATLKTASQC